MTNPAVEKMAEIINTEFMKHYPPGNFKASAQALSDAGYLKPPELTVLTDEDIEAVKLSDEEYEKLLSDMENYQPKEFKGAYFNAEKEKIIKHKIAQAQLDHTKKELKGEQNECL